MRLGSGIQASFAVLPPRVTTLHAAGPARAPDPRPHQARDDPRGGPPPPDHKLTLLTSGVSVNELQE